MKEIECPKCGASIPEDSEECPECDADLEEAKLSQKMKETLDMIDDETYEVKGGDSSKIIERLKDLSPKKVVEEEEFEEVITYECPVCGTEVSEDAKKCPGCGAIFE
ncbi:MAG: zinc-ribbon domain-containing protein [Thermoplasmatota archaeon]